MKTLIFLFLCFNYKFILGQQIDTVLVNNSITAFQVISTIDTIMLNDYLKGNVLKMSLYSIETGDFLQEIRDTVDEFTSISGLYYFDINLDNYNDINIKYEFINGMK